MVGWSKLSNLMCHHLAIKKTRDKILFLTVAPGNITEESRYISLKDLGITCTYLAFP